MSIDYWDLDQQAQYWEKRKYLQTTIKRLDTTLAEAHTALLEGQISAAKRFFLESRQLEIEAQRLAREIDFSNSSERVAIVFSQAIHEMFAAIVQGDLVEAARIRIQYEWIIEIEQALANGGPLESPALLPKALFEKSQQALRRGQFDRAEEYINQIVEIDPLNVQASIRLADLLLTRARHARLRADDSDAALLFVSLTRVAYERVKDIPEFAARRVSFENELAEEQDAAYFAAGKQAQQKRRPLRARNNYRLIPRSSPYGPQAHERAEALTLQIWGWAVVGLVVIIVLSLILIRLSL